MAKTVVSIEIGEGKTRVAVLGMGKKKQHVKKAMVFDTPQNAMEDGYLRDYSLFAEQLLLRLREAKIKPKDIVFSISSNKVISREITITAEKEKMIQSIVNAEVGEYFPMDLSEHIIAYSIIGHDKENSQYRLMIYAAPENLIYGYYGMAKELHCNIAAIDFSGNSAYQWFKRSTLEEISLIMEVNENSSVITILDKGEMGVQRTINYGVNTLAEALTESGSYDGITNAVTATELLLSHSMLTVGDEGEAQWREKELIKIREGRFQRMETEQSENETGEVVEAERSVERLLSDEEILKRRSIAREDVMEAARMLLANVRRVMDYYTSKNNGAMVQKIYVTGQGAGIEGIDALAAAEIDIPAEIYNVTEGVTFGKEAGEYIVENGREFLTCFGAVINPLGFRPAEFADKEKKKELAVLSAIVFVAATAVMAFLIASTLYDIRQLEKAIAKEQQEIDALSGIEHLQDVYLASQSSIQLMAETDALTFSEGEQLNEIITSLERVLPKRSLVHTLSVSGDAMMLSFSTVTKEEAAKVLMQLKEIPYIKDTVISGIVEKVDESTNRTEVSFTVNCTLQRYVPEAAVTEGEVE